MDWLKKKEETWKSILNSSKENISADAAELGTMRELIVCLEEQLDKETHICEIEWLRKEAELFEQKLADSQNRIADSETRLKNIQAIIAWLEGQPGSEIDCPIVQGYNCDKQVSISALNEARALEVAW